MNPRLLRYSLPNVGAPFLSLTFLSAGKSNSANTYVFGNISDEDLKNRAMEPTDDFFINTLKTGIADGTLSLSDSDTEYEEIVCSMASTDLESDGQWLLSI